MKPEPRSLSLIFSFVCLATALTLGSWLGFDAWRFYSQSPVERLQELWYSDVIQLTQAKVFPPQWSQIREIRLIPGTPQAKKWFDDLIIPVQTNTEGEYTLEVLLMDWQEGNVLGAIVQYDLTENKTNNLIWELGRTFVLKGDSQELERELKAQPEDPMIEQIREATKKAQPEPNSNPTGGSGK